MSLGIEKRESASRKKCGLSFNHVYYAAVANGRQVKSPLSFLKEYHQCGNRYSLRNRVKLLLCKTMHGYMEVF